jgi:hypothetical protein
MNEKDLAAVSGGTKLAWSKGVEGLHAGCRLSTARDVTNGPLLRLNKVKAQQRQQARVRERSIGWLPAVEG